MPKVIHPLNSDTVTYISDLSATESQLKLFEIIQEQLDEERSKRMEMERELKQL